MWAACSAPTDCLCDTPGTRRIAACGMCGERSEECTDGVWAPVSSCLGEGACEPGAVERMAGTWCRVFERLCRPDCTWSDWSTVVPAGECAIPGSSDCDAYRMLDRFSTEDCRWVDDPDCPVNP
ncbi:MAG: hypothetical protein M5U28_49140 [Sandaracinaceae bacterium]|nr:hypothetical protein [Sandaracinaceae bacterium]